MARDFFIDVNLNGRQIQNVRVHAVGALPSGLVAADEGRFVYLTTDDRLYFWDGGAWQDAGRSSFDRDRANHSGTQLAATISNFDTQVRTSRLDQMAAPTAAVSMNSQKLTNLASGTAPNDAVTLGQAEVLIQGLSFKKAARVYLPATADQAGLQITVSSGSVTTISGLTSNVVDGEVMNTTQRILIANAPGNLGPDFSNANTSSTPTSAPANGIYVVTALGGTSLTVTRASDMNDANEFDAAYVVIEDGVKKGTAWITTSEVSNVGTSPVQWDQFTSLSDIQALSPLQRLGNQISGITAGAVTTSGMLAGEQFITAPGLPRVARFAFRGDGSKMSWTFSHGFYSPVSVNPLQLTIEVYNSSNEMVEVDRTIGSNTFTVAFATPPATNSNWTGVAVG